MHKQTWITLSLTKLDVDGRYGYEESYTFICFSYWYIRLLQLLMEMLTYCGNYIESLGYLLIPTKNVQYFALCTLIRWSLVNKESLQTTSCLNG